jgi:hypothetical protein
MEVLIVIVAVSFLVGAISCHLFWKWYQSAEIKAKITELKSSKVSRKFDLGGGVTFYRPRRLAKGQEGFEGKLHGISEIHVIEHDGSVELFGAWNRNGKNQIDPYSLSLPTSLEVIDPDRLIEFGQYFVELGRKRNKEFERA